MTHPENAYEREFTVQGFVIVPDVVAQSECDELLGKVVMPGSELPGTRNLLSHDWCQALASRLRQHAGLASMIPAEYVAAQCTYFEKSVSRNWLVPVHQDLSIPVAAWVAHDALRGWSEKEGTWFVQPPVEFLMRLIAVRIHLDPCADIDGPLQFVPGTHTLGRVEPAAATRLRQTGPVVRCTLDRGGALVMHPLVLHASSKASGASLRRVLHFVFGPSELPCGLQWQYTA
ncbi:MAG TPA: phytanoyl-CoA dioxygenase family protein [Telluria sp.]